MSLGALAFLNPWLLAGLAALPIIYWLLRTVPPRPKQVAFPATRILVGLETKEKTPAKTPWWLMLLRMLAATLVILALAEPVLNPNRETPFTGTGPVVLVVDNGWAAASRWTLRMRMLDRLIAEAEGQSRPLVIVPTAATKSASVRIEAPASARSAAAALQPQPFEPDRHAALAALDAALTGQPPASAVWLTDGIDHDLGTRAFAEKLAGLASAGLAVVEAAGGEEALGLSASLGKGGRLEATVVRAGGAARDGVLLAFSARGQRLAEAPFALATNATSVTAAFDLPLELRNQVTRIEIAGEPSAGAVHLLDARSQWNRVGLISGESREQAQPLLGPLYYIQKALGPYAELVQPQDSNLAAGLDTIFKQNASIAILADIGTLTGELKTRVEDWVKRGGVLIRFAGPRLENGGDDLLPVALRIGGRTLGGALSWSTPQPLAPFPDDSLFAGLAIPTDVTVSRQVLADPARLGPEVKIWARLKDGTPLVTATSRGDGQIVLFHVTANSDWSDLPLSGLFVEMLRRITTLGKLAGGTEAAVTDAGNPEAAPGAANVLAPIQVLDGFGTLRPPLPTVQAIPAADLANLRPSSDHPPGYYGTQGSPRALNLIGPKTLLRPLPPLPAAAERRNYEGQIATPLKPWMLATALTLLFIDIVAVILLQIGSLSFRRRRPAVRVAGLLALAVVFAGALAPQSEAQSITSPRRAAPGERLADEALALKATAKVTFGYVLTGDNDTDEVSRNGLIGLGKVLTVRTAVEPGEPFGVNIVTDEIAFFPILYWPVLPNARPLPEPTLAKIDAYMKQGGMVIFDTRDYGQGMPSGFSLQSGAERGTGLQRLLGRLDLPRLEPVPEGHVLTKSFYLLRTFPGRWDGGQLWVEAEPSDAADQGRKARRADGVSSILVTSNDFAAAWALDDRNRPLYPTVPGGEAQREQAFRTGINIVMYALTGNYKADQVHIPALLERLGQ
jgi:Domain of unknown function (DUF4159)/Aerotolerance regulator N-terminal